MQWLLYRRALVLFVVAIFLANIASADFVPIALTSDSFNQDVIVEKTAPAPLMLATTASMDGGTANTNFGWYERGYNADWPSTGIPAAGLTFTAPEFPDHDFQMAPSYKTNNAIMIDSSLTSATLTLAAPAPYSRLSFLGAAGNGPGNFQFTVHYQNGTTQTGTLNFPDWLSTVGPAYTAAGRVEVNAFTFADVNANQPAFFIRNVTLSNTISPITQIG